MLAPDFNLEDNKKFTTVKVGDLKKLFDKYHIPNDVAVLIQRIEDVYFEKHGWTTLKVDDPIYPGNVDEYIPTHCVWYNKDLKVVLIDSHY